MSEITLRFIGIGDDGGKYEFGFLDILEVDSTFGVAIYEGKMVHIDPATIQPVDDPRKAMLEELKSKLENSYLDRISTTQEDIGGNTWMMFGDILHVNEDVIGEMEDKL